MARTKGTVKTPANIEPELGSPLDAREIVKNKTELLDSTSFPYPWVGMEVYVQSEDKKYKLKDTDTTVASNWEEVPGPEVTAMAVNANSLAINHDSFISYMLQLSDRVDQIEKVLSQNDVFVRTCTVADDTIKEDVLPNHKESKFCRKLVLEYNGTWSGDSYETVKINNKTVTFEEDIAVTSGEHTAKFEVYSNAYEFDTHLYLKKVFDEGTENEASVTAQLDDTFVLTIEVATGSNTSTASLNYQLVKMNYSDVDLDYPYPVLELRDGTVVYRENLTGTSAQIPNNLGTLFDIYACYNLGNTATSLSCCFAVKLDTGGGKKYSPYEGCEYCYMANWFWLDECTSLSWVFTTIVGDAFLADYRSSITKLDFSKIRFRKLASMAYGNVFYGLNVDYVADDIVKVLFEEKEGTYNQFYIDLPVIKYLGTDLGNLPLEKIQSGTNFGFKACNMLRTLGDLSQWQTGHLLLTTAFSACWFLEYIGDVSNWDVTGTGTKISNFFKACFKLKGIGDIGKWDVSNSNTFAWTFESCNNLGDEELACVANWNVGNGKNFRGTFSYLYESDLVPGGKLNQMFDSMGLQYPPTIVKPRTDLSFVEDWDMKNAEKLEGFFANNPYLTNVGDLRKWQLISPTITTQNKSSGYGMINFLKDCSALENLKMPSIPRGTDVDGFALGCTSLANIELNALNVAAISFADCPLTKQSVLNLINAATDNVDITLKADVYTAYASDSDVTSAIATKASSNITVQLISA